MFKLFRGASTISTALLIGLVGVGAIIAVEGLGDQISDIMITVGEEIEGGQPCEAITINEFVVPALGHGESRAVTRSVTLENGTNTLSATARCRDKEVTLSSLLVETDCTTGYGPQDQACSPLGCEAQTLNQYDVPVLAHDEAITVTRTATVSNGTQTYTATASCSFGELTVSGEGLSTACTQGYALNGEVCEPAACLEGTLDGYAHGALVHDATQDVSKPIAIANGTISRSSVVTCAFGEVTLGDETDGTAACDSGYSTDTRDKSYDRIWVMADQAAAG